MHSIPQNHDTVNILIGYDFEREESREGSLIYDESTNFKVFRALYIGLLGGEPIFCLLGITLLKDF